MKIDKQLIPFIKFGGVVILFNVIISVAVFCISYPILSDFRLLVSLLIIIPIAFILLFGTYLTISQIWIVQNVPKIKEPAVYERLKKNFKRSPYITFYLNWVFIIAIFMPFVSAAYLLFGYDNLYYHFYILFVCFFINLYFGYFSMIVWYKRTYPMGRFGIPVSIQSLKNKIVSLILPVVVVVTVIISIIVYFSFSIIIKGLIDETMKYQISEITGAVEKTDDPSSVPWNDLLKGKKGDVFLVDGEGVLLYSASGRDVGKKIQDVVEKGNQAEYLYENTITYLKKFSVMIKTVLRGFIKEKQRYILQKKQLPVIRSSCP